MKAHQTTSLPPPAFAGGTKAITLTPVVGTPKREYAEVFVPGEEPNYASLVPPPAWWAEALIPLD